ncbi:MAG: hypothetical protein AAGK23_02305 [Pseudomonadota bacterium]
MKIAIVGFFLAAASVGLSSCTTQSGTEELETTANAVVDQDQVEGDAEVLLAAESEDDPIICKRQTVTGSRLSKKRVCARRSQWADNRDQTRKNIDDFMRRSTFGS